MKDKKRIYEVILALDGCLYDTVKIQAKKLESIPKEHKILSYKLISNKSNSK